MVTRVLPQGNFVHFPSNSAYVVFVGRELVHMLSITSINTMNCFYLTV